MPTHCPPGESHSAEPACGVKALAPPATRRRASAHAGYSPLVASESVLPQRIDFDTARLDARAGRDILTVTGIVGSRGVDVFLREAGNRGGRPAVEVLATRPPFDNPLIVPFEQTMDVTDLLKTGPELVVVGETIERVVRR